jgi:transcriptional regulator with XRE-family HTH domain
MQQSEFAATIGISRSRLASYEHCKAPLRYEVGKQVCYRHNINQRWLATGLEPTRPYFDISPNLEFQIKPKVVFSEAFDKVLLAEVEKRGAEIEKIVGRESMLKGDYEDALLDNFHLLGEEDPKAAAFYIARIIRTRLNWLKEPLLTEYCKALMAAESDFMQQHAEELRSLPIESRAEDKNPLQILPLKSKSETVKLDGLLKRVKAVTSEHGKKTELASILDVSPARITEWLKGEKEPGGSTTLALLSWVEREEAKRKSPGTVTTSSGAKTRKSLYEKHQTRSSPKKRSQK